MSVLGTIFGFLGGPLTEVLETRKIKKEAQAEVLKELARAEVEAKITEVKSKALISEKKANAEVNWENIWATQAATSWKDEYWTIALSLPMFMAFIPGLQEHALQGFQVIDQMPEWYKIALLSAIGAAFGLRALTKYFRKGS